MGVSAGLRGLGSSDSWSSVQVGSVCDPLRLRALAELGLTEASDPGMEYFAQRVSALLGVPVALVSLVQADRQVFPGMTGLGQPWAARRFTPLSHSFCQHVVATAAPLVITDARHDPRVVGNPAIAELGVIGYAGFPLTDLNGRVLGSLCAIDTEPKLWSEEELDTLRDLAKACSAELRLRLALHDARVEHARSSQAEQALQAAFDQSQVLLIASQELSNASTVTDIHARIKSLFAPLFAPTRTRLVITQDRGVTAAVKDQRRPGVRDSERPRSVSGHWANFDQDAPRVVAKAVREQRLLYYPDQDVLDEGLPEAAAHYRQQGLQAVVCAPVIGATGVLGVLELGWDTPHQLDPLELAVISTTASYVARAMDRTRFLQHRIIVAHQLQTAMLTELPTVPGLQMAVRYAPADSREYVGGDWYDAVIIPVSDRAEDHIVVVSVGDVTGHDVHAATLMGQLRSMQRQADWDHPGALPSQTLTAVDTACAALGIPVTASAVHLHLHPLADGTGRWSMTWTNAGHPDPILIHPGGSIIELDDPRDPLIGYTALFTCPRRDGHLLLPAGSTLLLYTDGLTDQRGVDPFERTTELHALLTRLHTHPPQKQIEAIMTAFTSEKRSDDVIVFAIHIPKP